VYLVITGNPFATNLQNSTLEILLAERTSRGGQLVNESINPPSYLRSSKPKSDANTIFSNMVNYGLTKGLVQVDEPKYHDSADPYVQGKPVTIEYDGAIFDEPDQPLPDSDSPSRDENEPVIREVHDENDVGFFITEDQQPGQPEKEVPLPDPTE
jgi:hypothetical protein